ncbi:Fc.00g038700.m01.CDS01 [Cosmosporella sp. VM-42]
MADDKTGALMAASVVIIIITTLAIAMRLWIRTSLKTIGMDDYLITASWCFLVALCILVIESSKVGFGVHHDEVVKDGFDDYEQFLRYTTGCSTTFSIGISLAKSSFAVLYLRIQPEKKLRIANKILMVFLACQAIEEALLVIFKCTPVRASWVVGIEAKCVDIRVLWWTTFVFNLCTDLFLFIQPIPAMWKLQLPLAKRIGLVCMLSLGLLVCVTSIIRIVSVTHIGADDTLELASLVICSTIPCLRQVVQKVPWLNHALGLSSAKSSGNYYGQSGTKKSGSIPLKSYNQSHKDYLQSKTKSSGPYASQYGMTSQVVGGGDRTKNDSTEEIFPHKTDGHGAIMVTHELVRDVESQSSEAGSMRHFEQADHTKGRT